MSVDNTFRAAGKATIVDKQKKRTKVMKGGILSALNENNEIVSWVRQAQSVFLDAWQPDISLYCSVFLPKWIARRTE